MIVIHHGRAEDIMPTIPAQSVDSVVTDPPYPEIDRPYGRMTEAEWFDMMRVVVAECRRILKPSGSAVFILQANSERVGRMRTWLFEFQAWIGKEWGIVQDVYWWNHTAPPTVHCHRDRGLMRPSVKACVWAGDSECYRDQSVILWEESEANAAQRQASRALKYKPSGLTMRAGRCTAAAAERGGVTPFNLLPMANADSASSAGANGHGAGTPQALADWWIRYITPDNGTTCDPFAGSGTMLMAAKDQNLNAIGIEKEAEYVETARRRVAATADRPLLSVSVPG
jgi:DNA modification methylase